MHFFEYIDNPLCQKGFEGSICKLLKEESSQLKHMFTHKGRLMGIEPPQWERLMKYWIDKKIIVKAFTMSNAWENMKQGHKYGGGGEASANGKVIMDFIIFNSCFHVGNIGKWFQYGFFWGGV